MVRRAAGEGVRVIVLTSDKYLHALRPYAWLFNKYWGATQEVLVAGFTPPDFELPPNFSFHSIGKFEDYPIDKWTNALIKLLGEIEDEAFVLMLEDYWITRGVDTRAVKMCHDYTCQFGYVLRIDLTTDRLFSYGPCYPGEIPDYGQLGHLDLIRSDPTNQYHMSMMTAVWRRDNLLKVLQPDWDPWKVELWGTTYLQEHHAHDLLVLGTRQWPIRHTLAYRGGNPTGADLSQIRPEDVEAMKAEGIL
jgi:hypothetical protein